MLTFYFKNTTLNIPNGIYLPDIRILTTSKDEIDFYNNLFFLSQKLPNTYKPIFQLIAPVEMFNISFHWEIK